MKASATDHPTDETLYSRGLGTLDDALAESVDKHLGGCAACQQRLASMSSESLLDRLRNAANQPGSTGPVVSSLVDGLSMLEGGASPKAPPPADSLPPGLADHPDYEVIRELGQGGMGTVYLAKNRLMGRHEVLKVVSKHRMNRSGALDRFLVEIRNAARLHHTNIVTAYSATRVGESIVFAMEYVEGLDLSKLVKAKGPLPVANACHYVHQAALGLQHASELGMVHRDIKPSNLMLAKQGNRGVVKVLDFGLAKVKSEGAVDGGLTHEGQMLGTPEYVAPEQISDARRADIRADIYSLGCTLYCLLTGGPPFQADNLYEILQAHHSMDALPLNLARSEVPIELAALVARMLAKEPQRRFQTPKDVARALEPFFKRGIAAAAGPRAELSAPGRADQGRASTRVLSVATQPAPKTAPTSLAPPLETPPAMPRAEPAWGSLIKLKATEPLAEPAPAVTGSARARWVWPSAGVGLLLLGLIVAWGVIVSVKTPKGFIELLNLPEDAAVLVDGEEVDVKLPAGGKPAVISVTAGKKHKISVKKDGLEVSGDEVTVQAGGKEAFTVRWVPLAGSPESKGKADDRLAASEVEGERLSKGPPERSLEAVDKPGAPGGAVEDAATAFVVERKIPTADAPALPKRPVFSPVVGKMSRKAEFEPLFNGKDLTGWKPHPNQLGNWHVTNGVLIGSGPALSHLYTKRGDYTDYHLRVEARFNQGGRGGVILRCPFGPSLPSSDDPKMPDGFRATINVRDITGGIQRLGLRDIFIGDGPSVPFGQWFTMDVIVYRKALNVRVNGRNRAYKFAGDSLHWSGYVALQQLSPETVIEFRTIEIKELNRPDQKDSREIRRFPGTTDPVTRVAFSQDGLGILSGGNAMEVWTPPGGGRLLHFGHNYEIRLWAVASGQNLFTRQGAGWIAKNLAFSSDGRYAASSENSLNEQPILIWDLRTGNIAHKLNLKDKTSNRLCTALSFSADDRRVMAASTKGAVFSWDLVTKQELSPKTLDTGPISQEEFRDAAFTSDRQHLVTASQTGVVELWDLQTGKRLQKFAGHAARVNLVACSADGRLILSAGGDKTVRLWNVASGKELVQLKNDDWPVSCVAISPDGRRALSAGLNGPVHLWDLASGKDVCRLEGHAMKVNSVAFSPDGRQAVSGSDDTTVRLWQLPEPGVAGAPSSGTAVRGPLGDAGSLPASSVQSPARTDVEKPPAPAVAPPLKLADGTLLPPTRLVHVDEFNDPRTGLLKDLSVPHDPNHGRSDGVYFVYAPGGFRSWNIHPIRSECTCEVVANGHALRWRMDAHRETSRGNLTAIADAA